MFRYILILSAAVNYWGGRPVLAQNAVSGLEKLKTLVGAWHAKGPNDLELDITYEVHSAGSSLIETRSGANEPTMVTVFHLDGDSLMMTHYCAAGNQPRMRARVPEGEVDTLTFEFIDATNLGNPSDGHMHGLVFKFHDENRVTQIWTWRMDGQEKPAAFELTRK